jgi:uncharacterized protein YjbI with pentapeptide repeats
LVAESHITILKKGVNVWNKWRQEKPFIRPNLRGVDLTKADLRGANLRSTDLSESRLVRADFSLADLSYAKLEEARAGSSIFIKANLTRAYLVKADLRRAKLNFADFENANLERADLRRARCWRADFSQANLYRALLNEAELTGVDFESADLNAADLEGANLTQSDLRDADLTSADFTNANLTKANLSKTRMINVKLSGATLTDCRIFGISAWNLIDSEKARQTNLIITPSNEPDITVDNLEVAQFIYLMLHSEKIRDVINTIGQKGVLILGRFGERKAILEAIKGKLRSIGYLPFVFDFTKPTDRDFTETIKTLAGLSRFIIADITKPKSVPLELQAVIPNYMIPMVTIIEKGEKPFSMFQDLWQKHGDWVLEPLTYDSVMQLQRVFQEAIVDPANQRLELIRKRKAEEMSIRKASDYE